MRQLENSSFDTMCALQNLNNIHHTYFRKGNISFFPQEYNVPVKDAYSEH